MSGVNKAILIGHLGRDPEIRRTNAGDPVASFSVATSETWRDKASGERKERTEWHNIVIFNEGLTKIVESYLKKGSKVYLEGQMQTREFTDKEGVKRRQTEIVLQRFGGALVLLDRHERPAPDPDSYGATRTRDAAPQQPAARSVDDDIPF